MPSSGHDVTAVHMMSQCCGHSHKTCTRWGAIMDWRLKRPHPLSLLMVTERGEPWFFSRIAILGFQYSSRYPLPGLMQEAAISGSQTVKELSAGWSRERFDGKPKKGCERRSYSHAIVRRLKVILNVLKSVLQSRIIALLFQKFIALR